MLARPARGHCATNHPFVGDIEERTKRFITIEHQKDPSSLSKCHSQDQSSLFSLPAEIREIIFDYASRPNVDPRDLKIGPQCLTFLRMPIVWRVNLAWLRTCRRIWLEANSIVWQSAEPTFYRHSDRPDLYGFLYELTALNIASLKRLHIGQECHNLKLNDAVLRILDESKVQPWPPHLTVTLVAYPSLWEQDAISSWLGSIINHRKLETVHDVEVFFHVPDSSTETIRSILEKLESDVELPGWHVKLQDGEEKHWIREWGDVKLQNHWANKVDIPYRTFKLACRRLDGTCQDRPLAYDRDLTWDCWHLIPYRVMFGRRDSMEPDYGCADQLAEQWQQRWKMENSLLKFAD